MIQVGSKIYVLGGFTAGPFPFPVTHRSDVFDMATNKWSRIVDLPAGAAVNHGGLATDGRYLYLVAGQITGGYGTGTNAAFRYDTLTNTWTKFVNLPEVRFGGGMTYLNGKLDFFGGDKADRKTPTTDHWQLDLSDTSKGWVRKAALPIAEDHLTHAVIDGQIYAVGGEHGHHGLDPHVESPYIQHANVYRYDPARDAWTRLADLPVPTSHAEGGTVVINNKIVVMGGIVVGSTVHNHIQVYDPATGKWTLLQSTLPFSGDGLVSGYYNGKIFLTDGYHQNPKPEGNFTTSYYGTVKGI